MSDRPSAIRLRPGSQVHHYRIQQLINRGKIATVYRAHHATLNREVALKIFEPTTPLTNALTNKFEHEARTIAEIKHPNVIRVFEYGTYRNAYFMAMEWITGLSLRDILSAHPTGLSRTESERIFNQIASAIATAHERGIVHGNVKPDNILLDTNQRPVLSDFTLPSLLPAGDHTTDGNTRSTAAYLSPQQAQNSPTTPACDIYALGIVLYEMLTGNVPFHGKTLAAIVQQHLTAKPVPPSQLRVDIDPHLDHVVLTALSKQPEGRYASVREMLSALDRSTIVTSDYETLSLARPNADQMRKSRSEIRRFERARTEEIAENEPAATTNPVTSPTLPSRALIGVSVLIVIAVIVAAVILAS